MGRITGFIRELRALPRRAKAALALALVLIASVVAAVVLAVTGGSGDPPSDDGGGAMPSTTLRTGDLDIDVPEGWQEVPIPDLGVGLAVPPRWEAVVLSPDGLEALANASPAVPEFAESAHAGAEQGGVFYAAGQDAQGRVSDVLLRGAPETGVTDLAGLEAYAGELTTAAGRRNAEVRPVESAERPTVRLDFEVGSGDEVATGSDVLVLGPDELVWSLIVTSDDPAIHDDLVTRILGTLTLSSR